MVRIYDNLIPIIAMPITRNAQNMPSQSAKKVAAPVRFFKISLAEQAYDQIKRQILDQQLVPGQRLNIDALSRECGVSTSPLREALVRLDAEGLVSFTINAGFSVADVPNDAQMEQLLESRQMIECYCARYGAQRGDTDALSAMKKATDAMAQMRTKGVSYRQFRAYITLEQDFHLALVDSVGNSVISAQYQELHLLLLVARMSVVPESGVFGSDEAVNEHRAVISAFESGDGLAAERAIRAHIKQARRRIIAVNKVKL
jgi:DNA-binding GntR family transcriptional regulator